MSRPLAGVVKNARTFQLKRTYVLIKRYVRFYKKERRFLVIVPYLYYVVLVDFCLQDKIFNEKYIFVYLKLIILSQSIKFNFKIQRDAY